MPPVDWLILSLIANFSVGGVVLALFVLAIEYKAPLWAFRCTLLSAGGLLCSACILYLTGQGLDLSIPAAALGLAALAAAGTRLKAARQSAVWLMHPRIVWGPLLLLGLCGAFYARSASEPPLDDKDFPAPAATNFHMLEGLVAVTDLGREITLCSYDPTDSLLAEERGILGLDQYRNQIIRLAKPCAECNCHGWVYTGGKYAIRGRDVDAILQDNGYRAVAQPQSGDLVIYRGGGEEILHTGLVRLVNETGAIFVESKWGPLGVYLHPINSQPYGQCHVFYRSPRSGHVVSVVPTSSGQSDLPPLARADDSLTGDSLPDDADMLLSAWRGRPAKRQPYERPAPRVPGQRKS